MTHFAVLVLTPPGTDNIEAAVTRLLAPYDENSQWFREGSRWDWWAIGGRMTGMLDATYDPTVLPENQEPCRFCENGITTQAIADQYPAYQPHVGKTCIQCNGTGRVVKFAADWARYDGDVKPVAEIDMDRVRYLPTAIVTPDGAWHEQGTPGWFGTIANAKPEDAWGREVSALLDANREAIAVVVDCHV